MPPIVSGVNKFVKAVPGYVQDIRNSKTARKYDNKYHVTDKLNEEAKKLPSHLGDITGALTSVTVGVFSAAVQLVTVLTLTFFLMRDGRQDHRVGLTTTRARARRARPGGAPGHVYSAVAGYVVGNFLAISLIAGTGTLRGAHGPRRAVAVPLAVLMAFLDLIPLVGATIGGVVIGIVAAISDFPTAVIVWGIYFIVYQQIENNAAPAGDLPQDRGRPPAGGAGGGADRRQPARRARGADRDTRRGGPADRRQGLVAQPPRAAWP